MGLLTLAHRSRSRVLDVPIDEADALINLFNATAGPNWTNHTNWLTSANTIADWYGVTVAGGHVTALELPANNLVGAVDWVGLMAGLPALVSLDLRENPDVTGDLAGMIMPNTLEIFTLNWGDYGVSDYGCNPTISEVFIVSHAITLLSFDACPITDAELGFIMVSCANGIGGYTNHGEGIPGLGVSVIGLYAADHATAYNALIADGWTIGTNVRE